MACSGALTYTCAKFLDLFRMKFVSQNAARGFVLFVFCWLAGALPATAQPTPDEDVGRGAGYSYKIRYPELDAQWQALHDALHAYAETQKKDFLAAQGGERSPNTGDYQLDITFTVARRTDDFTSVLVAGSSFTGGAHPSPLTASFVAHNAANRLVAIGDLFTDENAALKILSDEARAQLQGRFEAQLREQLGDGDTLTKSLVDMRAWVERGTEPKPENFAVYLVDGLESKAIGLTLVFPPYQVAPYVDGAPQVEVPARLFHAALKPEYVAAFHWDTEAEKNGDAH